MRLGREAVDALAGGDGSRWHSGRAARRSTEPGHAVALDALGLQPILALDLRLGEGSGAALAIPVIRAAAKMAAMSTFEQATVSRSGMSEHDSRGGDPACRTTPVTDAFERGG